MDTTHLDSLLKSAGMRVTAPRQAILGMFQRSEYAMSALQLEEQLSDSMDRVTVYRILATFSEKGLLHKIQDPEGTYKYAMCSEDCTVHHHHDEHLHFHCTSCGKMYCLEQVSVPELKLPRGFRLEEIHLAGKGICDRCSH